MSLSTRSDLTSSSLSSSIVDIESGQGQDVCLDPPWVPVGVSTKLSVHAFSKGGLYFLTADVGYKEYEPATKTLAARTQAAAGPTHAHVGVHTLTTRLVPSDSAHTPQTPHQDPSIHPPVPTLSRSLAHVRPGVATDGIHLTRRSPTAMQSRAKRPWTLSPSSCSRPVRMREGRGGCGVHGSAQSRWRGGRRELSRGSHVGGWGPGAVAHPRRALCRSTSTSWTCARNRR